MDIRQATIDDVDQIVEFNQLLAKETEHRTLNEAILRSGVETILGDETKGMYFLAQENRTIVGQLMITYEWSDWRNGNFWWIQSVYVRKEFRELGVFRMLYQHVEAMAKDRGDVCGLRLYVEHENDRAQKVYEKMGMVRSVYEMFEKEFKTG